MQNSFNGRIKVDNQDLKKARTIEVDLPGLEIDKEGKNYTAGSQIMLKSMGGFQSCGITLWGTIPCSEEDFGTNGVGKAHTAVTNHLAKMALVFIEKLEQGWLPEGVDIARRGFDAGDFE